MIFKQDSYKCIILTTIIINQNRFRINPIPINFLLLIWVLFDSKSYNEIMGNEKPSTCERIISDLNFISDKNIDEYNRLKDFITKSGTKRINRVAMDSESRDTILHLNLLYDFSNARERMVSLIKLLDCDLETEIAESNR